MFDPAIFFVRPYSVDWKRLRSVSDEGRDPQYPAVFNGHYAAFFFLGIDIRKRP
jgi:hypothetical protein